MCGPATRSDDDLRTSIVEGETMADPARLSPSPTHLPIASSPRRRATVLGSSSWSGDYVDNSTLPPTKKPAPPRVFC